MDEVGVGTEDLPDARPLQTDATHVVVGDLDDLLEAEHARRRMGQLVQRHLQTQQHQAKSSQSQEKQQ